MSEEDESVYAGESRDADYYERIATAPPDPLEELIAKMDRCRHLLPGQGRPRVWVAAMTAKRKDTRLAGLMVAESYAECGVHQAHPDGVDGMRKACYCPACWIYGHIVALVAAERKAKTKRGHR